MKLFRPVPVRAAICVASLAIGAGVTPACSGGGSHGVTPPTHPPAQHYPTASACTPTPSSAGGLSDQCTQDTDCPAGQGCLCSNEQNGNAVHVNECITAQCRTDADCGASGYCSLSIVPLCAPAGVEGFYCHTAGDTCADDTDCSGGLCTYSGQSWSCETARCAG